MIRNYLKIAWRNILKNRVFSLINIIGLTIGLSAAFVIGLMIYYDATFDKFHKDGDRIYRVVTDLVSPEDVWSIPGVTLAMEEALDNNSNFETVSGFYTERPAKVENREADIKLKWPDFVIFTDPEYFDIFQYDFVSGKSAQVLSEPNQVILTESRAADYFPNTTASEIVGKTLVYNDSINVTVAGIVKNFEERTDIVFQEFISKPTVLQTRLRDNFLNKNWDNTNSASQLYVKISKAANLDAIQNRFDALAKEHRSEEAKKYGDKQIFKLQPLADIHFNEDYGIYDWSRSQASRDLLLNLGLVALFLLLLGCINFINLNTAQATQRAKEIGIRKTLGSSRKQLIGQFMGETFLLVIISAILSVALSKWLIKVFSDFVPEDLSFDLFGTPIIIFSIALLLIMVTFLSGFYPALVLSRFNTVSVLKNKLGAGEKKVGLRKFLTVFQFTIAQVFIIATLLVGKQINYVLNKDMGFKTESIVSVFQPRAEQELSKKELFSEKLNRIPQINKISIGGVQPASFNTSSSTLSYTDGEKEINTELQFIFGDTEYLNLFELELLAGRVYRNDTIKEIVINEASLKTLGFKSSDEAINKTVKISDDNVNIVGVMKNFHQRSLKTDIKPMALRGDWYRPDWSQFQAVHLSLQNVSEDNLSETLSRIEEAYKSVYTEVDDYRIEFMDETVARFYNREQKVSKLLNWATGLSILISCLGLFGLVIFTTNRRVKEIGVRKVLGATLIQINMLLCKEFLVLVAIAFLIAAPLAWYGIHNWLQDFSYRTTISFWVFLGGGVAMIVFALLVISAKTLQAANANPVDSLRAE